MVEEHNPLKPETTLKAIDINNQWVRRDQAEALARALEEATDQLEKAVLGDRIDTQTVNHLLDRKALEEYRK